MVCGKVTFWPAPGQLVPPLHCEATISSDCFLYSNLSPLHDMGEKWNLPGPQMMAPFLLASAEMRTFSPFAAGWHSKEGEPAASKLLAMQTWVWGPHLPCVRSCDAEAPAINAKESARVN